MPKYRLKASCDWIAGSDIEFGDEDFDNEEEAQNAAFESACERISAWADLVEDD